MEKDLHKDSLEEYFRKSLADSNEAPSQDGWDVPSDKVWENIEIGIPSNPSSNGTTIYKLKWFLAAIALLLLLISYQLYNSNKKLDAIANQIHENAAAVDELKKERNAEESAAKKLGFLQNKGQENLSRLVDDSKKITAEKSNSAVAEEPAEGALLNQKEKDETVRGVSVQSQRNDFGDKNFNQKNVASGSRHFEVDNSFNPQNQVVRNEIDGNRDEVEGKNNFNNRAVKKGERPGRDKTSNAIAEGIATKSKENPNVKDFQNLSHLNQIAPSASIASLELKTIFLERTTSPLANRSIPDYGIAVKKESILRARLSLGVYFSPTYSYRSLTSKISGATQSFNEEAAGKLSYNLGIQLGYDLTKRWTLFSGLNYHNLNQSSLHRIGLRYTRVGGAIQDGRFVNGYDAKLETSFGETTIEIRIADETPNANIPEGRPIPVLLEAGQHLEYLGIPLLAEYHLGSNRFAFTLKGGFVANFLVQRGLEITAVTPLNDRLIHRRTDIKSERTLRQLKDLTLDFQLGVGLHFGLSKNLQLSFEPTYRRNLTPVFENQRFKTNTFTWGINSGIRFHF